MTDRKRSIVTSGFFRSGVGLRYDPSDSRSTNESPTLTNESHSWAKGEENESANAGEANQSRGRHLEQPTRTNESRSLRKSIGETLRRFRSRSPGNFSSPLNSSKGSPPPSASPQSRAKRGSASPSGKPEGTPADREGDTSAGSFARDGSPASCYGFRKLRSRSLESPSPGSTPDSSLQLSSRSPDSQDTYASKGSGLTAGDNWQGSSNKGRQMEIGEPKGSRKGSAQNDRRFIAQESFGQISLGDGLLRDTSKTRDEPAQPLATVQEARGKEQGNGAKKKALGRRHESLGRTMGIPIPVGVVLKKHQLPARAPNPLPLTNCSGLQPTTPPSPPSSPYEGTKEKPIERSRFPRAQQVLKFKASTSLPSPRAERGPVLPVAGNSGRAVAVRSPRQPGSVAASGDPFIGPTAEKPTPSSAPRELAATRATTKRKVTRKTPENNAIVAVPAHLPTSLMSEHAVDAEVIKHVQFLNSKIDGGALDGSETGAVDRRETADYDSAQRRLADLVAVYATRKRAARARELGATPILMRCLEKRTPALAGTSAVIKGGSQIKGGPQLTNGPQISAVTACHVLKALNQLAPYDDEVAHFLADPSRVNLEVLLRDLEREGATPSGSESEVADGLKVLTVTYAVRKRAPALREAGAHEAMLKLIRQNPTTPAVLVPALEALAELSDFSPEVAHFVARNVPGALQVGRLLSLPDNEGVPVLNQYLGLLDDTVMFGDRADRAGVLANLPREKVLDDLALMDDAAPSVLARTNDVRRRKKKEAGGGEVGESAIEDSLKDESSTLNEGTIERVMEALKNKRSTDITLKQVYAHWLTRQLRDESLSLVEERVMRRMFRFVCDKTQEYGVDQVLEEGVSSFEAQELMYGCLCFQLLATVEENIRPLFLRGIPNLLLEIMDRQTDEQIAQHAVLTALDYTANETLKQGLVSGGANSAGTIVASLARGRQASQNMPYVDVEDLVGPRVQLISETALPPAVPILSTLSKAPTSSAPVRKAVKSELYKGTDALKEVMMTWDDYDYFFYGKIACNTKEDLRNAVRKDRRRKDLAHKQRPRGSPIHPVGRRSRSRSRSRSRGQSRSRIGLLGSPRTTGSAASVGSTPFGRRTSLRQVDEEELQGLPGKVSPLERRRSVIDKTVLAEGNKGNKAAAFARRASGVLFHKKSDKNALARRGSIALARRNSIVPGGGANGGTNGGFGGFGKDQHGTGRSPGFGGRLARRLSIRRLSQGSENGEAFAGGGSPQPQALQRRASMLQRRASVQHDLLFEDEVKRRLPLQSNLQSGLRSGQGMDSRSVRTQSMDSSLLSDSGSEGFMMGGSEQFLPRMMEYVMKAIRRLADLEDVPMLAREGCVRRLVGVIASPDTPPACFADTLYIVGMMCALEESKTSFGENLAIDRIVSLLRRAYTARGEFVSDTVTNACLALASLTLAHPRNIKRLRDANGIPLVVDVLLVRGAYNDVKSVNGASTLIVNLCYKNPSIKNDLGAAGACAALTAAMANFEAAPTVMPSPGSTMNESDSEVGIGHGLARKGDKEEEEEEGWGALNGGALSEAPRNPAKPGGSGTNGKEVRCLSSLFKAVGNLALTTSNMDLFVAAGIERAYESFLSQADDSLDSTTYECCLRTLANLAIEKDYMELFSIVIVPFLSMLRKERHETAAVHMWAFLSMANLCRWSENAKLFVRNNGVETVQMLMPYLEDSTPLRASVITLLGIQTTHPPNIDVLIDSDIFDTLSARLSDFLSALKQNSNTDKEKPGDSKDSKDSKESINDSARILAYSQLPITCLRCAHRLLKHTEAARHCVSSQVFALTLEIIKQSAYQPMLSYECLRVIFAVLSLFDTEAARAVASPMILEMVNQNILDPNPQEDWPDEALLRLKGRGPSASTSSNSSLDRRKREGREREGNSFASASASASVSASASEVDDSIPQRDSKSQSHSPLGDDNPLTLQYDEVVSQTALTRPNWAADHPLWNVRLSGQHFVDRQSFLRPVWESELKMAGSLAEIVETVRLILAAPRNRRNVRLQRLGLSFLAFVAVESVALPSLLRRLDQEGHDASPFTQTKSTTISTTRSTAALPANQRLQRRKSVWDHLKPREKQADAKKAAFGREREPDPTSVVDLIAHQMPSIPHDAAIADAATILLNALIYAAWNVPEFAVLLADVPLYESLKKSVEAQNSEIIKPYYLATIRNFRRFLQTRGSFHCQEDELVSDQALTPKDKDPESRRERSRRKSSASSDSAKVDKARKSRLQKITFSSGDMNLMRKLLLRGFPLDVSQWHVDPFPDGAMSLPIETRKKLRKGGLLRICAPDQTQKAFRWKSSHDLLMFHWLVHDLKDKSVDEVVDPIYPHELAITRFSVLSAGLPANYFSGPSSKESGGRFCTLAGAPIVKYEDGVKLVLKLNDSKSCVSFVRMLSEWREACAFGFI